MAYSRPVVGSRTGGTDLVEDGLSGLLVPAERSLSSRGRLVANFADHDLRHSLLGVPEPAPNTSAQVQ